MSVLQIKNEKKKPTPNHLLSKRSDSRIQHKAVCHTVFEQKEASLLQEASLQNDSHVTGWMWITMQSPNTRKASQINVFEGCKTAQTSCLSFYVTCRQASDSLSLARHREKRDLGSSTHKKPPNHTTENQPKKKKKYLLFLGLRTQPKSISPTRVWRPVSVLEQLASS